MHHTKMKASPNTTPSDETRGQASSSSSSVQIERVSAGVPARPSLPFSSGTASLTIENLHQLSYMTYSLLNNVVVPILRTMQSPTPQPLPDCLSKKTGKRARKSLAGGGVSKKIQKVKSQDTDVLQLQESEVQFWSTQSPTEVNESCSSNLGSGLSPNARFDGLCPNLDLPPLPGPYPDSPVLCADEDILSSGFFSLDSQYQPSQGEKASGLLESLGAGSH